MRERERVCVWERARERESACQIEGAREGESEKTERARGGERNRKRETERVRARTVLCNGKLHWFTHTHV